MDHGLYATVFVSPASIQSYAQIPTTILAV